MVYCFGGTLGPNPRPGGWTLVAGGMRPKSEWLEATARAWNRQPTPFVWGGNPLYVTPHPVHRRWRAGSPRHAILVMRGLAGAGRRATQGSAGPAAAIRAQVVANQAGSAVVAGRDVTVGYAAAIDVG
jgi:hypothetical protein